MTKPDEVREIVGRLTKAQREALLASRPSWSGKLDRVHAAGMTRKALRERGLGHGDWCYLTPLGLAVRAHLLSEQTHEQQ